jgi:threonine synthase
MIAASRLVCAGCGWIASSVEEHPYPFRCARRRPDDDIDHVVVRTLASHVDRPSDAAELNPFIRYRGRLHSYHVAASHGISDEDYVDVVRRLNAGIVAVDGRGFRTTPLRRCDRLSALLGFGPAGGVFVKDETGNVSGSHKARHLMGIMLYLEVLERLGLASPPGDRLRVVRSHRLPATDRPALATDRRPPTTSHCTLAIASCGNAALAAAVVAGSAGWPLEVFVPSSAESAIVARLRQLGAHVSVCERRPDEKGDPSHLRFQEAVASGALPFSVQGSDNGLTIEGAETLAWEMIDALGSTRLDRLIVQVGGGALASACVQAFREALAFGTIDYLPRVHAVQTEGGHPLARAYGLVAERLGAHVASTPAVIRKEMDFARTHRSQFMWPWESQPRSIARGILDDETYDWAAVVEGMLLSDGYPVVVDEPTLEAGNTLARDATAVNVDHTGSAGLAGLLQLMRGPSPPSPGERVATIFSGVRRERAGRCSER